MIEVGKQDTENSGQITEADLLNPDHRSLNPDPPQPQVTSFLSSDNIDRQVARQCRRGLLELDLLLERFLQKKYATLSLADRERLYALLDRADTELLHWLTGKEPCEPGYADLIEKIGSR